MLRPPVPTETERRIAGYVSSLIGDGDCIQLGVGGIPNAMGDALTDKRDLGVHTEMITASMGMLMRDNPNFELRRAAYTNNPSQIAKNDNMVSVNTAIEIDLTGQVCSESIGSTQFSGTGGAADFAYGAYHAKGAEASSPCRLRQRVVPSPRLSRS